MSMQQSNTDYDPPVDVVGSMANNMSGNMTGAAANIQSLTDLQQSQQNSNTPNIQQVLSQLIPNASQQPNQATAQTAASAIKGLDNNHPMVQLVNQVLQPHLQSAVNSGMQMGGSALQQLSNGLSGILNPNSNNTSTPGGQNPQLSGLMAALGSISNANPRLGLANALQGSVVPSQQAYLASQQNNQNVINTQKQLQQQQNESDLNGQILSHYPIATDDKGNDVYLSVPKGTILTPELMKSINDNSNLNITSTPLEDAQTKQANAEASKTEKEGQLLDNTLKLGYDPKTQMTANDVAKIVNSNNPNAKLDPKTLPSFMDKATADAFIKEHTLSTLSQSNLNNTLAGNYIASEYETARKNTNDEIQKNIDSNNLKIKAIISSKTIDPQSVMSSIQALEQTNQQLGTQLQMRTSNQVQQGQAVGTNTAPLVQDYKPGQPLPLINIPNSNYGNPKLPAIPNTSSGLNLGTGVSDLKISPQKGKPLPPNITNSIATIDSAMNALRDYGKTLDQNKDLLNNPQGINAVKQGVSSAVKGNWQNAINQIGTGLQFKGARGGLTGDPRYTNLANAAQNAVLSITPALSTGIRGGQYIMRYMNDIIGDPGKYPYSTLKADVIRNTNLLENHKNSILDNFSRNGYDVKNYQQSTIPTGRVQVVSPDGKIGHIPQGQLQDAIKLGYKVKQ